MQLPPHGFLRQASTRRLSGYGRVTDPLMGQRTEVGYRPVGIPSTRSPLGERDRVHRFPEGEIIRLP